MQDLRIEYRGRYEYADVRSLERAIVAARAELADEDGIETDRWFRFFVYRGTRLTVNVSVAPTADERFAAANLFLVLAQGAVDGSVEAVQGARVLDHFEAGLSD